MTSKRVVIERDFLVCTNEEINCVGEQVMEDNCVCDCEQEPPPKCALDLASKF